MARTIMHLDMDAFFAAIEQRDNPAYRGKPLIVGALPGGRGVVSTCSYEARKYGIHSAMPISQAYKRCPHGIYLLPDIRKYAGVSRQLMAILESISPLVEPISIDEAFVDITGLELVIGPPDAVGRKAKEMIRTQLHITGSVGIGLNRLIAKIASDFQKPDGLTIVEPESVLDFLAPLPVSRLRGVGKRLQKDLERLSIRTVAQLRAWSQKHLAQHFGEAAAEFLYQQARGIGSDVVGTEEGRKSASKEVTFDEDVNDQDVLRQTLLDLSCEVGRVVRREELRGRVVTLKIRLEGFETHTRQTTLDCVTCSDRTIFQTVWELYQKSGYVGRPVRLIGVGLSGWHDDGAGQLQLFRGEQEKEEKLFSAVDQITQRFGRGAIRLGQGGAVKKRSEHDEEKSEG